MLLRFRVFEQTISAYPTKSEPRQGSVEYLQLQFIFSDDWKDLGKTLYFQSGDYSTPVEMKSDTVTVPEYYTEQPRFSVTLFGKKDEVEVPTNVIEVQLLESNRLWVSDAPIPQPSWIEDLIDLNDHPPYPGTNGFWMTWDVDLGRYKESDIPLPDVSVGPAGKAATIEVAETVTGEPSSAADVVNIGDENAARLRFTIPRGQAGPVGATPQISVTVETLPPGSTATVEVTGTPEKPEIKLGIPQGAQGERGQQGIQGVRGWSVSAAALDEDGALVLTIRNPADGSTQTLPPVPIDNSAALQAVVEAITAQGTTQVQRVEDAGDTAVGAVSTAKDAALQAVGQAQETATGAVSSAKTTAVQAVQTAQGAAETAIGEAQTAAVEALEAKGTEEQGKLNAIVPSPTPEDAGKVLVVNEDGTGLKYIPQNGYSLIEDIVLAENCEELLRTEEPDGTPYDFKSVTIVTFGGDGATGNQRLEIGNVVIYDNIFRAGRYAVVRGINCNGITFYDFCGLAPNDVLTSSNKYSYVPTPQTENIKKLYFRSTIVAGSRIKIYGVRA